MLSIMHIIGVTGLLLSFFGSGMMATSAIKRKEKILQESRQRVPVVSTAERLDMGLKTAYDKALLRMPEVQARLWQSKVAFIGVILLTVGFLLQLISAVPSISFP